MDKLKMHSPNFAEENIAKIVSLFPNCVKESTDENGNLKKSIDFDLLRQELSTHIVEGAQERYHLNWPGKRKALLTANTPIAKTLRPCHEESVNFDTTKNLFIEGDNLDALKLLQEIYPGKVKMIYIDPPYNIGKDVIYVDNFAESTEEYMLQSGQKDEEGNRLVTNTGSNGRFHSNWLSMMYPRLKLARNLLQDDGVIFISIDDIEVANLRKICDEIFGVENRVGTIVWKNVTDNNPSQVVVEHEYIHVYAHQKNRLDTAWKSKISDIKDRLSEVAQDFITRYDNQEERQEAYTNWFRENKPYLWPLDRYKYIDGKGIYTGSQSVHNPGKEGYRYDVLHPKTGKPCNQPLMGYRFPSETMDRLLAEGKVLFGEDENKIIELKVYVEDFEDKLSSVITLDGRLGAYDLKHLFPESSKLFSNPKPIRLLSELMSFLIKDEDILLDFFSGSCASAQSVLHLNKSDSGRRRFIMVQLPEPVDLKTEVGKNALSLGFKNISEIGKERIRRAGKKIKEENDITALNLDIGFRVLKVDSSNMMDVYYTPDETTQTKLFENTNNIKDDRTAEDLLFQVLLDWGIDLTLPITKETIKGLDVFFVDGNALAACFVRNGEISEDFCKELAKREPLRVVFRDSGFSDDAIKINVEQIFKLMSQHTDVKTI